jgi:radical SAM superfamily enzyme YgiQ (UPF0313 family)
VRRPRALLINPPIYDFALFDHYFQPYGLFRLEELLTSTGYEVSAIDALDITDPRSINRLGRPTRRPEGTGKFFRQATPFPGTDAPAAGTLAAGGTPRAGTRKNGSFPARSSAGSRIPAPFADPGRSYARYGIVRESLREAIRRATPDIAFVTTGMTYWYPGVVEVYRIVSELFPRVPILAGGIYASLLPEHCQRVTGATPVPGPAEENLPPVLERLGFPPLASGKAAADAATGTGYTGRTGSVEGTNSAGGIGMVCGTAENDMTAVGAAGGTMENALSQAGAGSVAGGTGAARETAENSLSPAEAPPRQPARFRIKTALRRGAGILRLSAGCPFRCAYCASRAIAPCFREGDPVAAYTEFDGLYRAGVRNFAFYDDAILFAKERLLFPFLERIREKRQTPAFYMPNACHAGYLDGETAKALMAGGFREVRIGFESASPEFHAEYGIKYGPDAVGAAVEAARTAGYQRNQIRLYILAGMPGQTREEIEESVRFALALGARPVLAEYSPVPGSPLWERCVSECRFPIADEPLYQNNTLFPMEWEGLTRADLEELKGIARGGTRETE